MNNDHENTEKARQCAAMLCEDIRAICCSENMLLSDAAMELMALAGQIERKLARMELAIRPEGEA